MAGATAAILIPELSSAVVVSWQRVVARYAVSSQGQDFWVSSIRGKAAQGALPFYSRCLREGDPDWELDQEDAVAVRTSFGFVPKGCIRVGAMCRGRESDWILARVCLALLEEHNGALMFHGLLSPALEPSEWKAWNEKPAAERAAEFKKRIAPYQGTVGVATIEGEPSCHVVDGEFLAFWIRQDAFHFVN